MPDGGKHRKKSFLQARKAAKRQKQICMHWLLHYCSSRGGKSSRHWQLEATWGKRKEGQTESSVLQMPNSSQQLCSSYRLVVPSHETSNLFPGPLAEVCQSPDVHKAQTKPLQYLSLLISSVTCTVLALSSICRKKFHRQTTCCMKHFLISFELPSLQQNERSFSISDKGQVEASN